MENAKQSNFERIAEQRRVLQAKRAAQAQKCGRCVYKTEISPGHLYCPFAGCMAQDKPGERRTQDACKQRRYRICR